MAITIWDSVTFTAPFPDNVVATSAPISNGGGSSTTGVRVFVEYTGFSPDGDTVPGVDTVYAVLEEEVTPGVWVEIAQQIPEVAAQLSRGRQVIVASPATVDPGQNVTKVGSTQYSVFHAVLGDAYRVRLMTSPRSEDLQSVTVRVYSVPFNE